MDCLPDHQTMCIFTMLKLIFLTVFVANLNFALTDTTVSETTTNKTEIVDISVDDPSDERIRIRCGPNQVYLFCPMCPPATCRNKDQMGKCIKTLDTNNIILCPRPRCQCIDGLFLNFDGKCVKKEECPSQCNRNEVDSDCATNPCLPTCEQPDLNLYCRPNPAVCKPGCICADGYLRGPNGICILKEICSTKCKDNEVYTNCTTQICRPQSCKELGYPVPCPQSDQIDVNCKMPGCVCKEGFVRNVEGVCIPIRNCTSCGGDPNAWSSCTNYCTRCKNYQNEKRICLSDCNQNTCECKEGYAYNSVNNKCVLIKECPRVECGPNEVNSNCANSRCIRNCTTKDMSNFCRPYLPGCETGCVCVKGTMRDDNGICIPIEKCPPSGIFLDETLAVSLIKS